MKNRIVLFAKGVAMGAADVVPGVSGGTVAFISGIYETLINSIKSVDKIALQLLFRGEFKALWKRVNGEFLLPLFLGIAISILSLAKVMTYLLANNPIEVWSFFFGLIIASSLLVAKDVKRWSLGTVATLIIGAAIAYSITTFAPSVTPNNWYYIVLSGAIAICAMILPGISGSFILLLLGKYSYIISAIDEMNLAVIAQFGIGAAVGIVSFSHILSWLLKRFHNIVIALLTGFMIGSLNKVWPWKETIETYLDRHGVEKPLVEANILPATYEKVTEGADSHLLIAVVLAVVGFFTIWGIEKISTEMKKRRG